MNERSHAEDCCNVFNRVFPVGMPFPVFWHKHYKNPYRFSTPVFIHEIDDQIAGINGYLGTIFVFESEELYAVQSCDSAVVAEYRHRGVFTSIMEKAHEYFTKNDIRFIYGFANEVSFKAVMKLGWKHQADFCRFILPLNWYALLHPKAGSIVAAIIQMLFGRVTRSRINRLAKFPYNGNIEEYDRCPLTDEDCTIINGSGKIMIKRSPAYYEWKCDKNPAKTFTYIVARENDRLSGFVVYYISGKEINIVDWFCKPDKKGFRLMARLIKRLMNKGDKINVFFVNILGKDAKLMKELGFWNTSSKLLKRSPSPFVVCSVDNSLASQMSDAGKWTLRHIDVDALIS